MKKLFFILLFSIYFFPCFSQQQKISGEDSIRGILSRERTCFDVHYYDLSLSVNVNKQFISGSNAIYFKALEDFSVLQLDLFNNLSISKITDAKDSSITYERKNNALFVHFRETQKKNNFSFLKIYYEGQPHKAINAPWDGGFVWTLDSLDRSWVSVACEGVGASLWWPCKDHPSDEPDSMRMQFEVPQEFFCASNGNLIDIRATNRQTKIYEWAVHYPVNTYNITLNIGNYVHFSDTYTRKDNSILPLDYYVLSYNLEKAKKHFAQVKPMLACYEKLFGNYPFEKDGYALIEAPYWGMEHQSAIAYGNRFKNNMVGLDYIIVHESGHEWWGNNISVSDHADLWIHEAFTTYGETLLLECLYNTEAADKYLQGQNRLIRNREPIIGPYGVNYHYWQDSDMYYKGARMLHTLRHSLDNDSLWFALLLHLQKDFSGKQISTKELVADINNFVGYDYSAFFSQYLTRTDLPVLEYEIIKKDKKSRLRYRWKSVAENFSLPLIVFVNDSTKIKIEPTMEFKTLSISSDSKKQNSIFPVNSFYIVFEQIKSRSGSGKE
jgi:aminopeptidase N